MPATNTYPAHAGDLEPSSASGNEPSMEDILASIRRIIAEDQSNGIGRGGLSGFSRRTPTPAPQPETILEPEPEDNEAEATEADGPSVRHERITAIEVSPPVVEDRLSAPVFPAPQEPGPSSIDALSAIASSDPEPSGSLHDPAPPSIHRTEIEAFHPHDAAHGSSVTPTGDDEGGSLISSVASASVTSSFKVLADTVLLQDPGLIERIARETLRPMLKTWLDDHLPNLVERLVRAEIERVARGGRDRN